ncbi:MAG TPA: hypothetical protein ENN07_01050 [candidate division Zixibacteria bacterium]|nr:hypothetical protein [candidate division Zixibacteria bacterium]
MKSALLALIMFTASVFAVPVRVLVIRGGYSGVGWTNISRESYRRAIAAVESVDGIDIILFPEFAFAGIDGGGHSRPEITFTYDEIWGYIPYPRDSTLTGDVSAAQYLDSLRYLAIAETCYIFAATCGEVIAGVNYNTMPVFHPDGRLHRLRRKNRAGAPDIVRDTTIYNDTIATKAGPRIAVMTTICYENGSYGFTPFLDPVDPPAPLWLLPHGTWSAAGNPDMTYRTQRWIWNPAKITLAGQWRIPEDGWVRGDAVLISADIFSANWTAMRIDNYGEDLDPLAYEPLAWVEEHSQYVVIDINVPDIDDPDPVVRAKPAREPYFEGLTALPKISSGVVTIEGAPSRTVEVYSSEGELVSTLIAEDGCALWEGLHGQAFPPGEYTILSGSQSDTVLLAP